MAEKKYDVIVIGGGPAGLTAAIYTLRKGLSTLIVSMDLGGQVIMSAGIENYPGIDSATGPELMDKFRKQVDKFGGKFTFDEVKEVLSQDKKFIVKAINGEYEASAVILAFGLVPRSLGVPGEDKFKGRGVSYCATCDAPLYKGKTVAVVGGGNSALQAVEELSRGCEKIYLIHRRGEFRADEVLIKMLDGYKNVEQLLDSEITEFTGDKKLTSIIVKDVLDKKENREIVVDGVFLEIGYITQTSWIKNLVELNERGEIAINDKCQTAHEGVFAAGDVTTLPFKQIVISAGEGAKAALSAYNYISKTTGVIAPPDWGVKK